MRITHRERVLFPDAGHTKGALADYYGEIAEAMLAHVARRPISLVRCPKGIGAPCFFQKHHARGLGDAVARIAIREKGGAERDYLYVKDARGLLQCVQMDAIEFHGWGARCDDIEAPDRMVFDLDPDEGLAFAQVCQAAGDLRDCLLELGLASFAMLTGGKGIHVVVPLARGHDWRAHRDFAKRFAEWLSRRQPERFTASMSKSERKGRIFIDWLRNARGNTAIMPYSVRARPSAPVAAPVAWDELDAIDSAQRFTIDDAALLRQRSKQEALRDWGRADQPLRPDRLDEDFGRERAP